MLQKAVSLSYLSDVKMNTGISPVWFKVKLATGSCTKKRTFGSNIKLLASLPVSGKQTVTY